MRKTLLIALLALVMVSCGHDGRLFTSVSGAVYECLVVCDDNVANEIRETLGEDMYGLPQLEHTLKVVRVNHDQFNYSMMASRNILQIDIDPHQYTKVSSATARDVWAKPQAYVRIKAPNAKAFLEYWNTHGATVREWFVREELSRKMRYLKGERCKQAEKVLKRFQYQMFISNDYLMLKDTTLSVDHHRVKVLWCCNNKGPMRRDLMLYQYPYLSQDQFSNESIVAMRDSIVSRLVSAQVPGSYMITEWKFVPPVSRSVTPLNDTTGGFFGIETRGLWKIQDGEAMGGPFISLTRLDQVNSMVVHAEGFLYAPGQKKRTAIRELEAILYTLKMPNEK